MLERIIRQLSMVIALSIAIVSMWATIQTVDAQASILTESGQNSIVLLADVGTPTTEAKPSLVEQAKTLTEMTDEAAEATAKAEKKAAKAEAKKAKKLAKAEAKKAKELAKAEAKKAKKLAKAEAKAAKVTAKSDVKSESES
jgi:septal ring factor EnvC (AmiA/AmiB activator)